MGAVRTRKQPNVRWNYQGLYEGGGSAAASYLMLLRLNFMR